MSALLNILAPLIAHGQTTHELPMNELLNASYEKFLSGTMHSAPGIFEASVSDRRQLLETFDDLSERHDKAAVFQHIFKHAMETCMVDRDRSILLWTQTLLETLLGFAVTADQAEHDLALNDGADSEDEEESSGTRSRGLNFAAATKQYMPKRAGNSKPAAPRRTQRRDDDDAEYRPSGDECDGDRREPRDCRDASPVRTNAGCGKGAPGRQGGGGGGGRRNRKNLEITEEAHDVARRVFGRADSSDGGYVCSPHFFPSDEGYAALLATLQAAKRSMDICIFTLTDDTIVNTLIDAQQRGVKIRIICDDIQAKCLGADPYRLRDEFDIPMITDHGVAHMHNKFAVLDGKVLITGSYNWTKAAHYNNSENIVIMNHQPTIKQYEREYERLWGLFHNEERQGMKPCEERQWH